MKNAELNKAIKRILTNFAELNGAKFVGIKRYVAKTSGEIANHVINANFNYGNAVEKDLTKLYALTENDIKAISENTNVDQTIVLDAINALIISFEKNQNDETKSNQSKAQSDAYINITNSIKLNIESRQLHIYALAVSKQIIKKGEYKTVNSRPLTIAKNAVKKYCDFTTSKYRNFIIDENMLSGVNVSGEQITIR